MKAYSYRTRRAHAEGSFGAPRTNHVRAQHEVLQALISHRELLERRARQQLELVRQRDRAVAQAVEDGLSLATVASAIKEGIEKVRYIVLFSEVCRRSGLPRLEHIRRLKELALEVEAATAARVRLEGRIAGILEEAGRRGWGTPGELAEVAQIPLVARP